MGILTFFNNKSDDKVPLRLPSGSFTVDPKGRVVASTLPASFPVERVGQIGSIFLRSFKGAEAARVGMTEIVVEFSGLKLTAKYLRGGAIIFVSPRSLNKSRSH